MKPTEEDDLDLFPDEPDDEGLFADLRQDAVEFARASRAMNAAAVTYISPDEVLRLTMTARQLLTKCQGERETQSSLAPSVQPAGASNDAWYHLGQLAASGGDDGTTPTSYQPHGIVAGDFKIHRSYSKARNVVLLRFETSSEAASTYVGRRVLIKVQGREPIDLGAVNERGQASCTVQGPVVLADAMVNIES